MPSGSDTADPEGTDRQRRWDGLLLCVAQTQLVLVDLVQSDRERLVLDVRIDERPDVVEQVALVEVRVVVVDLTRALGCVDDELVLRLDLLEQRVDGGIDDSLVRSGQEILLEFWRVR